MGILRRTKNRLRDVERFFRRNWFILTHGYNYEDTWSLDQALAKWISPRLTHLRDNAYGYPGTMTPEEWDAILTKMIIAFNLIKEDDYWMEDDNAKVHEFERQIEEGLDLFREHYFSLWD